MMKTKTILLTSILILLQYSTTTSFAQSSSCSNYNFINKNQVFSSCNDLPFLNSFLHWTYTPSSQTVKIAYRQPGVSSSTSTWVAWAINPTSTKMSGAQALVAIHKSDGSITLYTSPVSGYKTQLPQGNLTFPVSDFTATYSNNEIIIFATLGIQTLLGSSSTTVNQVWNQGPLSSNDIPAAHPFSGANLQSMATLNLLSGESGPIADSGIKKKNIHGVLNVVSWGILMPVGAVIARYLKVFPSADPAWFYLHVTCQLSGYIVGVAGWATGIHLGKLSKGIQYTPHRIIGILLFSLATIQVLALLLRPNKEHKYRFYWKIYHHSFGYAIISLSIVNIFKGFDILNPEEKWKRGYIGFLASLAAVALIFELCTWFITLKRRKSAKVQNKHTAAPIGRRINGGEQTESI